ncbi:MAG TPA: hypothetical protein VKT18_09795, partial [Acidimicrobiales bacterium]|nr:hypothetical protein [Acidimicrobiales bacterium]
MRVEADTLAVGWGHALDAASRALVAVRSEHMPLDLLEREQRLLTEERLGVMGLLGSLGGWLPPHLVTPNLLGLAAGTTAVVFDLDGVLTDS